MTQEFDLHKELNKAIVMELYPRNSDKVALVAQVVTYLGLGLGSALAARKGDYDKALLRAVGAGALMVSTDLSLNTRFAFAARRREIFAQIQSNLIQQQRQEDFIRNEFLPDEDLDNPSPVE